MKLNSIFDKYELSINKLLNYGFKLDNDYYIYKKYINSDLYVLFKVKKTEFILDVYDKEDNLYLPFKVKNNNGNYVSKVREEVEKIKENVLTNCFKSNDYKDKILNYVYKTYKTKEEYPWDNYDYFTLKVNNKWYLLFMEIPYKILKINKEGTASLINVKLDPEEIKKLIDNKNFLPAYHMNKKYWMTIILDNNIDINIVYSLIDQSYNNVNKK